MTKRKPKPRFIPNIKFIPMETIEKMTYPELKAAGLIRETQVMYHNVREEVLNISKETGLRIDEIRKVIGKKYFRSPATIHSILYGKVNQ
jgi:hypothetical protein